MTFSRVYVDEQVDMRLRTLRARTGLTPNLLCRLGLCLSLADASEPDPTLYQDGNAREFNRFTLSGEWDLLFMSLLKERLELDGQLTDKAVGQQYRVHLSRGVMLLYQRLRRLEDLAQLINEARRGMFSSMEGTEE